MEESPLSGAGATGVGEGMMVPRAAPCADVEAVSIAVVALAGAIDIEV